MKKPCPECRSHGRDQSGDNLVMYPDGHGYCFSCGYYQHPNKRRSTTLKIDVNQVKSYPIKGLTHKPISKKVCEKYGVRTSVKESNGAVDRVYYPYYNAQGNLCAYKVRIVDDKQFHWIGEPKQALLFGTNTVNSQGKLLIVTEGEDDALAATEMLLTLGKNYNVVSIPNGASEGKLDPSIAKNLDLFSKFDTVLLAMDMDAPGKATAESMAIMLAPFTKVGIMSYDYKDAGDILLNGTANEFFDAIRSTKQYVPNDIIAGKDITKEEFTKVTQEGYSIPYPKLQDKLHGLRKRELTLLCAGSGVGKTTLAREISYSLVRDHDLKVANIFLEEGYDKTAKAYIAIDNNVPLPLLRIDPNRISNEQWDKSIERLFSRDNLWFNNHFGSIASDRLISKIRYFVHACDIDFIILDHLSMVISGQESSNERKDIDLLMTNLAAIVNETGVGVIAIVHLKRPPNGEAYNEGRQISLSDLRGSGGLEQLSWNVIGLERDQQNPGQEDFSKIRLLKNREWGYLGECDTLFFNKETGRLLPHDVEGLYDTQEDQCTDI